MKVRINKPCRVNLLSGDVEVTEQEYNRLKLLNILEIEKREIPELVVEERETRKKKK